MNKDRQIISELNSYFAESNNTKAIQGIMNVMSHITLNQRQMNFAKAANCKFTACQVLELMVLFPFFAIKNSLNFAGTPVKLFFYRNGKNGEWNALLSTNTALSAYEAYKIYSIRWAIEVAFSEAKRLLNLGKCQCRDFASQIASISLCMLQNNILGYVKRYESYEAIGGVFRDVTQSSDNRGAFFCHPFCPFNGFSAISFHVVQFM